MGVCTRDIAVGGLDRFGVRIEIVAKTKVVYRG